MSFDTTLQRVAELSVATGITPVSAPTSAAASIGSTATPAGQVAQANFAQQLAAAQSSLTSTEDDPQAAALGTMSSGAGLPTGSSAVGLPLLGSPTPAYGYGAASPVGAIGGVLPGFGV